MNALSYIYFVLQECKKLLKLMKISELHPFNLSADFYHPQMQCGNVFGHSACLSIMLLTFEGLYLESLFLVFIFRISKVSGLRSQEKDGALVFCVSCLGRCRFFSVLPHCVCTRLTHSGWATELIGLTESNRI